ncbi:sulfate ABC transporter permease subunit CysT [Heliorestis convoluta]|uniref:Sulfate transport system permease protein CysT n=1 Tax=Heliorestis convoluta TaxID=356322 RepID=A0A5Q2N179_9FIRM|nr:sulfate ABC transporter permease subunit CysT [Heliorestis convoluta]QGG49124.1 sulfate ABC transporter, permease protein CysT [Heliorestis convoluta]
MNRLQTGTNYNLTALALRSILFGYLLLLIVLPLSHIFAEAFREGWAGFWHSINKPDATFTLLFTFFLALFTAIVNAIAGTFAAYVLVRYPVKGKTILNSLVDLPFAIPTAVSGLMLLILYGPQSPIGSWLSERGIDIIYAVPGILLAMIFVTFPFSIRAVQPLLMEMGKDKEEVAHTLGASRWQTFRKITLPSLWPGIASGFSLTFSRALAEFGSIVIVAGNIPLQTQVASVYIYGEVESFNLLGASAVSVVLLFFSFSLLYLQSRWFAGKGRDG